MNVRIGKKRAIEYIILCYAFLCMLLVGPLGLMDGVREVAGTETAVEETMPLAGQDRLQQVFIADGGYLEKIGIYTKNDFSGKTFRLTVFDEESNILFSRMVAADDCTAPGFLYVPVEFDTEPGRAYVWQIGLPETELILGRQDTAGTIAGVYGNFYYINPDGEVMEQVGQNVPMRLVYSDPLSAARKAAVCAAIAAAAAFAFLLVENAAGQRRTHETVSVQWAVRRVGNPLLAALTVLALAAVTVFDCYGGKREDKIVYCTGICVLSALLFYVINVRRLQSGADGQEEEEEKDVLPEGQQPLLPVSWQRLKEEIPEGLQAVFWAGVLWGCMDYVNAMYTVYQEYAFRKTLIFLGLALLTMCGWRAFTSAACLIWTALASVAGILYCHFPERDVEAAGMAWRNAVLFVVAGLVLIQVVRAVREKRPQWKLLNLPYSILLGVFFGLLVLFRNTRGWPLVLTGALLLLYFFWLSWERRGRFMEIFCNGVILNFMAALLFAVLRRPFRAWFFYRYNFVFHTVTVTSAYLTLVLAALFIRLLVRYHRGKRLYSWWGSGLLFGMAASLLIMTLSRTGYLAAFVMGLVILIFVSLVCYRERLTAFLKKTGILILVVLACFPVTYSAIRLIPPLYDDPYIFELEAGEEEWAIHKGDPADSANYITFSRFAYCFDGKLFGDEHVILRKFVDFFLAEKEAEEPAEEQQAVAAGARQQTESQNGALEAGMPEAAEAALTLNTEETDPASETGGESGADGEGDPGMPEEESDYSNGRMEIFRRYMAQWNLTGHDGMGVELADGSLSVHAHNTYLQVIHDHGLITGLCYLLVGAVSLLQMFRYAYYHLRGKDDGNKERDVYAALPLAVFLAFAVAGLVEWLFHPCNPLGFSTMAVLTPLLTFQNGRGRRARAGSQE